MKLFISEKSEQGYVSEVDCHWCNDYEILRFGLFQTEDNRKGTEVSMCGVQSSKFTTHILVKDLDISKEFLSELIIDSFEKSMKCVVNNDGSFKVNLGEGWEMDFNINDILSELISKAEVFDDGDKVICRGRILNLITS